MAIIFICWQNPLNFTGNELLLCKFLASTSVCWSEPRSVTCVRCGEEGRRTQWGLVICVRTFVVQVPRSQHLRLMPTSGGAVSINVVRHNILSHQEFGGLLSTTESDGIRRQQQLQILEMLKDIWRRLQQLILKLYFKSKHKQVKFIQMRILWKGQS